MRADIVPVAVVMCMPALTSSAKRITILGLSEAVLAVAPEVHMWKQQIAIAARLALAMADSARLSENLRMRI